MSAVKHHTLTEDDFLARRRGTRHRRPCAGGRQSVSVLAGLILLAGAAETVLP